MRGEREGKRRRENEIVKYASIINCYSGKPSVGCNIFKRTSIGKEKSGYGTRRERERTMRCYALWINS